MKRSNHYQVLSKFWTISYQIHIKVYSNYIFTKFLSNSSLNCCQIIMRFLTCSYKIKSTFYPFLTKFISNYRQFLIKFLSCSYRFIIQILAKFLSNPWQILSRFLTIFYKIHIKLSSNSYQVLIKFI